MRLAILHDWLNQRGGAEDVLADLHRMYPEAPILTSIYDRERMPEEWRAWDVRSSWMDRLPGIHRRHQPYLWLFAAGWGLRTLPDGFDLVLSNKSGFCILANTRGAPHVCYCLAPSRYVFEFDTYAARERIPRAALPVLRAANVVLRAWERRAAASVTQFVAISSEIRRRISDYYGRDAVVIHPPVDTDKYWRGGFCPSGDYALIVSRLLPYKRIDLAIEACRRVGLRLVVAGAGRDESRLRSLAGAGVTLLGWVPDEELAGLINGCRMFLFPGLEDFGIAPVHAMACGKPVIAFAGGGSLDTIVDGGTGLHFKELTADSMVSALRRFDDVTFAPGPIRAHAERFNTRRFERELGSLLEDVARQHPRRPGK